MTLSVVMEEVPGTISGATIPVDQWRPVLERGAPLMETQFSPIPSLGEAVGEVTVAGSRK